MNFAQEIEFESGQSMENPELALRMECAERRLNSLEGWLNELANDMLDRFAMVGTTTDCETERIGS